MPSEMDWSPDFCLACDRQTSEGAYCSQACRLADLERAGTSEPVTPMDGPSTVSEPSWASSGLGTGSGFYLPPAINFAAYKSPTRTVSAPTSPHASSRSQTSYFSQAPTSSSSSASGWAQSHKRGLTPSSSRSSLSSVTSTSSATQGLSDQALSQLRSYANAFDQARDPRRRLTLA